MRNEERRLRKFWGELHSGNACLALQQWRRAIKLAGDTVTLELVELARSRKNELGRLAGQLCRSASPEPCCPVRDMFCLYKGMITCNQPVAAGLYDGEMGPVRKPPIWTRHTRAIRIYNVPCNRKGSTRWRLAGPSSHRSLRAVGGCSFIRLLCLGSLCNCES